MTGKQYSDLVAAYLAHNFRERGVEVYREVAMGKSIIGKNRRVDILVVDHERGIALAVECKFQQTQGTADEKIPYTVQDTEAMWTHGIVAYAGEGWSDGVLHMLRGSETAAYCLPDLATLEPSKHTRELDHVLACVFGWWDVVVANKAPFDLEAWRAAQA